MSSTNTYSINVSCSKQTEITDANGAESGSGPALATYNNQLYMAYRGEVASTSLYSCFFDGSTWQPQINITSQCGAKSSTAPALAVYNNRLYMAYKGATSDDLYCCYFDGNTWQAQVKITDQNGAQSDSSPALAVYNNRLYMAYKGQGSDKLYYCYFDGTAWRSQGNITDANDAQSGSGPALAAFNGKLYLAYGGKSSNNYQGSDLYVCSFDGGSWSSQTNLEKVNGAEEYLTPALATLGSTMFLIYRGAHTTAIWGCAFNGSQWSNQVEFSSSSLAGAATVTWPALASFQNKFFAAYTGIGTSQNLWSFSFTVS